MQQDRLRTLLDLAAQIAEKKSQELAILWLGKEKWWAGLRSVTQSSLSVSPNTITYASLEDALQALIIEK